MRIPHTIITQRDTKQNCRLRYASGYSSFSRNVAASKGAQRFRAQGELDDENDNVCSHNLVVANSRYTVPDAADFQLTLGTVLKSTGAPAEGAHVIHISSSDLM